MINIIINFWQFDRSEKESSRRIWEMEIWGRDDDSIRRGMMKKDWIFVLKFVTNIIINWLFDRGKKESSRRIWEMEIWGGDDDSIRRGMMKKDWIFVLKFVTNIIINCWKFDRREKESSRRIWKIGNLGEIWFVEGWWKKIEFSY